MLETKTIHVLIGYSKYSLFLFLDSKHWQKGARCPATELNVTYKLDRLNTRAEKNTAYCLELRQQVILPTLFVGTKFHSIL